MANMPNIEECPGTYLYDGMAIMDGVDQFVDRCGAEGTGIVKGTLASSSWPTAVSADGTDLTLTVASGVVQIQGTLYTFAGGTITVAAGSTTDRRDLLVIRSGSLYVIQGTPWTPASTDGPNWSRSSAGTGPAKTAVNEATDVALAEIYVPATVTAITQAMLVDKRVVLWGQTLRSATANTPGTTETVNTTSAVVLASNPNRIRCDLTNTDGFEIIYLSLGGTAAVGAGVRLNPNGGTWSCTSYTGAIEAVCTDLNDGLAVIAIAEV